MVSQRSNRATNAIPDDRLLDAARGLLVVHGPSRTTMADVARAAGVSRATLYRRWPNVTALVATLATREFAALLPEPAVPTREALVSAVTSAVRQLRKNPLVRSIVQADPEFLLPYLLHRRGTSTTAQLAALEAALRRADRSVATGDRAAQARAIWLAAASFVLTGPVLADRRASLRTLDAELGRMLDRYLTP